jgi:hypothetical protein
MICYMSISESVNKKLLTFQPNSKCALGYKVVSGINGDGNKINRSKRRLSRLN